MKQMVKKSLKERNPALTQFHTKSLLSREPRQTGYKKKSMVILFDELKQSPRKITPLLYISPELLVLDNEEKRDYLLKQYLLKKSLQPLWSIQEAGVIFAQRREADLDQLGCRGYMLCDEMGLGKSMILLSTILLQNQSFANESGKRFNGPTLIVCKDLLIDHWLDQLNRFPEKTFHYYILASGRSTISNNNNNNNNEEGVEDEISVDKFHIEHCCDIVFTTYATVTHALHKERGNYKRDILFDIQWRRIAADEAHIFVNECTDYAKAMYELKSDSKVVITGQPKQNADSDILTLIRFTGYPLQQTNSTTTINDLSYILEKLMLRRLRKDVLFSPSEMIGNDVKKLSPQIQTVTRRIELVNFMTKSEKLLYYMYAKYILYRRKTGGDRKRNNVPHLIQLMRQFCIDPSLVKNLVLPANILPLNHPIVKPVLFPFLNDSKKQESKEGENRLTKFMHKKRDSFRLIYNEDLAYRKCSEFELDEESGKEGSIEFEWNTSFTGNEFDLEKNENDRELYEFIFREISVLKNWRKLPESIAAIDSPKVREMVEHILSRVIRFDRPFSKEYRVIEYIRETPIDDKIIIFSSLTGILHRLDKRLREEEGIESVVVTGKTKEQNKLSIERFRKDPSVKVLLITLKLGNEGHNFVEANHVIVYDPWWNPFMTEQAEFRIQREGQKKKIFIVYFIMNFTIEVYIINQTMKKKTLLPQTSSSIDKSLEEDEVIITEESPLFDYTVDLITT